ncbi:hypothetical protein GCM10023189_43650 [Nibrella saemangeumensis]|uniref:Uncharacterized protein n=1 Tax=Nibrella saemangeumensis TaxID=1084526 RepID=A0ABP8NB94_9BACT
MNAPEGHGLSQMMLPSYQKLISVDSFGSDTKPLILAFAKPINLTDCGRKREGKNLLETSQGGQAHLLF